MSKNPENREEARRMALAELAAMTEEEDAAITADALADPDNQPMDGLTRRVGRPRSDHPKVAVSLRIDQDVVDRLKRDGHGWQTRVNAILRRAVNL